MEENQGQQPANNQQSTVTEVAQQPQTPQPHTGGSKKDKNKKGLIILVIAALIIIITTTLFFFFQSRTAPEQTPTEQETTQDVEIESAEGLLPEVEEFYEAAGSEATAGWKTYTNAKYNYQIKFPNDWVYNRGPGEVGDEELNQQRNIETYDPQAENPGIHFMLDTNEFDATGGSKNCSNLDDCVKKAMDAILDYSSSDPGPVNDEFMGYDAKSLVFTKNTESFSQTWYHLLVLIDGNFYHFSAYTNADGFDDDKPTFDQILSTFEFIEESTQD